jgi:hypothetical protein
VRAAEFSEAGEEGAMFGRDIGKKADGREFWQGGRW